MKEELKALYTDVPAPAGLSAAVERGLAEGMRRRSPHRRAARAARGR